jgi:hypothetical protein
MSSRGAISPVGLVSGCHIGPYAGQLPVLCAVAQAGLVTRLAELEIAALNQRVQELMAR